MNAPPASMEAPPVSGARIFPRFRVRKSRIRSPQIRPSAPFITNVKNIVAGYTARSAKKEPSPPAIIAGTGPRSAAVTNITVSPQLKKKSPVRNPSTTVAATVSAVISAVKTSFLVGNARFLRVAAFDMITSEGRRRETKILCRAAKERRYPLPI